MRRNGSTALWDGDYDDREADGFEGQSVEESQRRRAGFFVRLEYAQEIFIRPVATMA